MMSQRPGSWRERERERQERGRKIRDRERESERGIKTDREKEGARERGSERGMERERNGEERMRVVSDSLLTESNETTADYTVLSSFPPSSSWSFFFF